MQEPMRKRCNRYNVPGHTHYLTFSCFGRQQFLVRERTCGWFIEALNAALIKHDYGMFAWVIMPEHVHLLVKPRGREYSISDFLGDLKKPVTDRAIAYVRCYAPGFLGRMLDRQPNGTFSHRFWQRGGGYDTNLWTPKYIAEKINYIHGNPVRRGLVKEAAQWEWSSAREYAGVRPVPVVPIDWEAKTWLW
jgi:putative transposase